ncbi:MAG TPA: hypothetical protein QF753_08975 [Victivallales bacterium]|nr:hypothetical protein [Victivallales bacterium]
MKSDNAYANTNNFKNLKWEITVNQVKKYYPNIKLIKKNVFYKGFFFTSKYSVTKYYESYGAEELLLNRDFYFCYDKLGIERIRYHFATPLELLTEINKIYGKGKHEQKIHGWASKQIRQNIRVWILPSGTTLIMIYFDSTYKTDIRTKIGLASKNFYLNIIFIPPHIVEAHFEKITKFVIKEESIKNINSFIYKGAYY